MVFLASKLLLFFAMDFRFASHHVTRNRRILPPKPFERVYVRFWLGGTAVRLDTNDLRGGFISELEA